LVPWPSRSPEDDRVRSDDAGVRVRIGAEAPVDRAAHARDVVVAVICAVVVATAIPRPCAPPQPASATTPAQRDRVVKIS
jgi:hypothetical protein